MLKARVPRDPRVMGLGMRISEIDSKVSRLQSILSTVKDKLDESKVGLAQIVKVYRDEQEELAERVRGLQETIENLTVEKQRLEDSLAHVSQNGPVKAYRSYHA